MTIERKMYDSCLTTSKVDGDYDNNSSFGASMPFVSDGLRPSIEEYQENYAWVSKLGMSYFNFILCVLN